jgi:hypothetical protein
LKAVSSTVLQFIRSGVGMKVVLDHVVRLESYVYLCVSEQFCDFVYKWAMETKSDPIFMLHSRCGQLCMLFLKYFISHVMQKLNWEGITMGNIANHVPF